MKITVTVRSEGKERPSGHKLSPMFAHEKGAIDHKETFTCAHAKEHAMLFMEILDLSAMQCGIISGEFKPNLHFSNEMDRIVTQIKALHQYTQSLEKPQRL